MAQYAMFFGNIAPLLPLIREGRLRGLAVTSPERFAATPEFPSWRSPASRASTSRRHSA
jgi:tripartite-type tricarboxylate transporter receptor subunit TctC